MVSFIESNQHRSVIFFIIVSLLLIVVSLYPTDTSLQPADVSLVAWGLVGQTEMFLTSISFWVVMSALVGVVWARVFLGRSTFFEALIMGSVLLTVAYPVFVVLLSLVLYVLSLLNVVGEFVVGGVDTVYALLGVVVSLLLGVMFLIGKEVAIASRPSRAIYE